MRARWLMAVVGTAMALTGQLAAMEAPVPVAPGSTDGVAVVRGTCPTFHWGEVDGAGGYELVVFRLTEDGERAAELYRVGLPGGAQGWTPTVERCLEAGRRYAWALRTAGRDGQTGPWSEARVFEIASRPSVEEVEQALVVLRRWMEEERSDSEAPVDEMISPRPEPTGAPSETTPTAIDPHALEGVTESPGQSNATDGEAVPVPAAAPVLGTASITIDEQFHMGPNSAVFKGGGLILWEDALSSTSAFGRDALKDNTTGTDNTAIGRDALKGNTSGFDNTAVGTGALSTNVTGFSNTALGEGALRTNSIGDSNTAVGKHAMEKNTTGKANAAFGWDALKENTTGESNTAVGVKALHANTTGLNNTAVGLEAIGENATGNNNTAMGNAAMHDNAAGSDNAAFGARALRVNTNGNDNVAIGLDALLANTTGNRNTAVGNGAGSLATTGSDNIYIGGSAVGVAAEGNTIRIGGTSVGTGNGQQNRAFINGITGVNVSGAAVMVNASGQLGVTVSSRRYKEGIRDMGEASRRLLALRPVTFHYRNGDVEGPEPLEFGLIAEEVAELFPELVVYDAEGQPQTVKYHLLSSMLLNELQQLERRIQDLDGQVEALTTESPRTSTRAAQSPVCSF